MLDRDQAKICSQNSIDLATGTYGYMPSFAYCVNSAAQQMSGDYPMAISIMNEGLNDPALQGDYMQGIMLHSMAKVCMMQAHSTLQLSYSKRLLKVIMENGVSASHFWGNFDLGCSLYLLNEIDDSIQCLQSFQEIYESAYPDIVSDIAAILSFAYQAHNQSNKANNTANILNDYTYKTENKRVQLISQALLAELALRQTNSSVAQAWANTFVPRKLNAHYFFYLPEFTYAKVLLSKNTKEDTSKSFIVLTDLEDFSRKTHNHLILIPALALQSIILEKQGDIHAALNKLEEAVLLSKPGGSIRLFIDLFPELEKVLLLMIEENTEVNYIHKILEAKPQEENGKPQVSIQPVSTEVDPLSLREIEVLEHLSQGLRNKEIAEILFVAPDTVKKHLRNVFSKLDVNNRINAVRKARELGIIEKE